MSTAWPHLPNAKHIDFVLASLKANPEKWAEAWNAAWAEAWNAAWVAAWKAALDAAKDAAENAAWDAGEDSLAARSAILALIVYDDFSHLLYSNIDEVRILARIGVPAAILMKPAVLALSMIEEMV